MRHKTHIINGLRMGKTVTRYTTNIFIAIKRLLRVINKLPNSEQSSKGKIKTHKYIHRQNQSTTGKP